MDWKSYAVFLLALLPIANCWTAISREASSDKTTTNVSPYIDILLCPIRTQPWSCAREQSGRILDIWDDELRSQWQKLKVEADRQVNATIEKRGYSASEVLSKEKPSTILKKIEIGTGFMKEYLAETMDGFLGREYEYMANTKNEQNTVDNNDEDEEDYDNETAVEDEAEDEAEEEAEDNEDDDDTDDDDAENENENENVNVNEDSKESAAHTAVNTSGGDEFIEINDDANHLGQLKRPGGGKGNRKKKKGQQSSLGQPATVVLVQQAEHDQHDSGVAQFHGSSGGGVGHGHGHGGGHGGKQKRKRRKKQRPVKVQEAQSSHFGLGGLLDELVDAQDLLGGGGGKKKFKSSKYGRSNGVTRGKKKKKKKALAKLTLLGSFLKAKIELLLKLLGAHLQIKFFAIALIGLLINIARFWIDVKRGGIPQKVVYVEHAHHQHHYEEQPDEWSEPGGGGYWKRSLLTDPSIEDKNEGGITDSYQPKPQSQYDAQYMAYRNQWRQ